jgi:hypothetical protein
MLVLLVTPRSVILNATIFRRSKQVGQKFGIRMQNGHGLQNLTVNLLYHRFPKVRYSKSAAWQLFAE